MPDQGGLSSGGIFNFLMATDMAAGAAKVAKARKKAQNQKNLQSASEANLARWSQSLSNQKLMERAGVNYGRISENIARAQDAKTLSNVGRQLAQAEALGAATAAFAAAGVGGSSTESYNRTIQTSQAIQNEAQDRNYRSSIYLANEQRGTIISDAVDSQSRDVISANFDYTNYGPTKGPSLLGNVATLAVAAAASAAGAPEIGNMILNARTAGLKQGYGDGNGASKSFSAALDDLKEGVHQVKDTFRFSNNADTGIPQLQIAQPFDPNSVVANNTLSQTNFLMR